MLMDGLTLNRPVHPPAAWLAIDFARVDHNIWSMPVYRVWMFALIGWCLLIQLSARAEQPNDSSSQKTSPSIQQQLDELKQGQEQLIKQVEEIRKLLQEKSPRPEFGSKPTVPIVSSINVFGEPFRGANTARVAIVEYSNFDCSFCGKFARTVFPRIDEDYISPGKVRYYFRDLPEPQETNAWLKARAARCAGDQGKFWEMHELLFANQTVTGHDLATLAQAIGLDSEKFNECLSSEKYLVNIERSVAGAKGMEIFGTPAFLIGTLSEDGGFVAVKKVLVGAESYDSLKAVLDPLLGTASEKLK